MKYEQKTYVGLKYVFDLMSPSSGFGKEKLKELSFYRNCERTALIKELDNVESVVRLLREDKYAFTLVQHALSGMKDITGTLKRLKNSVLSALELFELKLFLSLSAQIKEEFEKLNVRLKLSNIKFHDTKAVLKLLSLGGEDGFFISDEYSGVLKGIRQEKIKINLLLERADNPSDIAKLKKQHMEVFAKEDEEENRIRKSLCLQLSEFADYMLLNASAAADLDILLQKANLAVKCKMSKPVIGDRLVFVNMINPLIEESLNNGGKRFTPISIEAVNGTTVITGANMGGKTVALKTLCLNVCLALYGFFVYAESAEIPLFDFVEMTPDNIVPSGRGLSCFAADVVKINELFSRSKNECGLILSDEFASGTNVAEGTEIFRAVIKAFNDSGSTVIMTTHFDGVALDACAHYQVAGLKNLPVKAEENNCNSHKATGVVADYMDYGLIKVPKDTKVPKDALAICRFLGLDEQIMSKL